MSVGSAVSFSPRISWSSWQHTQSRALPPPYPVALLLQLLTVLTLLHPPQEHAQAGWTPTPHHGGSKTQCPSCCWEALRFHSWVSTVSQRSFKVFERISSATSIKNKRHNKKSTSRNNKKADALCLLETESQWGFDFMVFQKWCLSALSALVTECKIKRKFRVCLYFPM